MDNYLYLIINLSAISIPLALSFEGRVKYINRFFSIAPGLLITICFFILWDILFTKWGIWGFNKSYLIGIEFLALPIEEWLFFICIPYSSLFIHYCKESLTPKLKLSKVLTKFTSYILIFFLVMISLFNLNNFYTLSSFMLAALSITLANRRTPQLLSSFIVSYIFILIPFFIINGLLTGSFILDEIVWYNDNYNLGIRIGTIPFEDIFYGFSLLFLPLYIDQELRSIKK